MANRQCTRLIDEGGVDHQADRYQQENRQKDQHNSGERPVAPGDGRAGAAAKGRLGRDGFCQCSGHVRISGIGGVPRHNLRGTGAWLT